MTLAEHCDAHHENPRYLPGLALQGVTDEKIFDYVYLPTAHGREC